MFRRISRRRALTIGVVGLLACASATAEEAFRFPRPGASFGAGTIVEAAWDAPCDRAREHEGELVLSLDDGLTFPIRLTGEMPACVSGQRWRVPDVATSDARLGLRRGRHGLSGEERIVLVGARFTIVGGAGSEGAGLTRGPVEWWTHQALLEFSAEDFLDETLAREPHYVGGRPPGDPADDPDPEPMVFRIEPRARPASTGSVSRFASAPPAAAPSRTSMPLRL